MGANKAKLPAELQQETDAKAFVGELEKIVNALSTQLTQFDQNAKQALDQLKAAQAQKDAARSGMYYLLKLREVSEK